MNVDFYETCVRYYEAENADFVEDLILYSTLAEETGDPILDLGCGTGRVMLHLAQDGYRTVGLDNSQAMLDWGRRKLKAKPALAPRARFVHGDALNPALDERFKLIIIPYNTLMHFSEQDDQLAVLRQCYRLLDDEGLLVIDLPNAGEMYATQGDGTLSLERTFKMPDTGNLAMQFSVSDIDRAEQMLHLTWVYDEVSADGALRRTVSPLALRLVFPGEMDLMLAGAGLECIEIFGDYMRGPFEDGCPRMIVVAQRAEQGA
ncbi:MAG TPA: class I SAM-dependent methyltransferase [Aggregatilinea sp.]|jgi:ubiquinone/menaquinone biosynthesis C-methylase UbiE|uniref:class I SAM-dependent methyltransferase n=1 Tax=Aggregatilinea sp. TaxID=2806333 RepID=UPI002C1D220D|nr:class I SAM-dependent methyltransferase [Aggregatilinea sp.]HML22913.1 class I SAM-dependent methyltransferase [Aggregatilinea sp.]